MQVVAHWITPDFSPGWIHMNKPNIELTGTG
jgi:hypothetical protein